ncbi:HD-GYP domain-containing protein [Pseudoneobacillus sp. C159]
MKTKIRISGFNPRKSPIFIFLGMILFPLGILIDSTIFKNSTLILTYVPFMIIVGLVFRSYIIIILLSLLTAWVLYYNSVHRWTIELFIFAWFCYFLLAFTVKVLMDKVRNEQDTLVNLIITLAVSLDARDRYTASHSKNVAYYSQEIARAMKLSKRICDNLYIGGLLHDIGKIGVPESILNKPSRLTDTEYNQIKQHPRIGYEILKNIPYFNKNGILDMVLFHHEKYDGTGYPHQKQKEEIPLVGRIIAISDAFDAMTSKRAYRTRMDIEYAFDEIKKGRGTQFDPQIADVFLELVQNGKILIPYTEGENEI